jgi:hypothetical protein
MDRQPSKAAHVLAISVARARAIVANAWQTAIAGRADKYQPEAHYMRGPGPKWRAKHARISKRQ